MRSTFKRITCFALVCAVLIGMLSGFGVSAEEAEPTASIVSKNLFYGDTLNLQFAVKAENLASGDTVRLKVCDEDGEIIETVTDSEAATVKGLECLVFTMTKGVPAQKISTKVYAAAEVVRGGSVISSSDAMEYSVLQYLYDRLIVSAEAGNVTPKQKAMYLDLLAYASSAQKALTETAEEDLIGNLRFIKAPGTSITGTYKVGEHITGFSHGLSLSAGDLVVWQLDYYDMDGNYVRSEALFDSEFSSEGFTVGEYNAVITARTNELTEAEYLSMPAAYGSFSTESSQNRIRIIFSERMKAGTTITFTGDSDTYKFAVIETDNPENVYASGAYFRDSGWNIDQKTNWNGTLTSYTMVGDYYPGIILAYQSNGNLNEEDHIKKIHSMFTVSGNKADAKATRGEFTVSEFNEQAAHHGNIYYDTGSLGTRFRITISTRLEAGTTIVFKGGSAFKWAVAEADSTKADSCIIDTGWNNDWADPSSSYTTEINGAYITLSLSEINNTSYSYTAARSAIFDIIYDLFEVKGNKYYDAIKVSEANSYSINSVNHRGYSAIAPENTLAAYRLSAESGFNAVECDVNFTKDGYAVLLHDDTIDRTSNGTGSISALTLDEVRALDFGSWKSPYYKGEKIPTFDEFISLCKKLSLHPYIELKSSLTADQAKILVDTVEKHGMLDKVSWISFKSASLAAISAIDETARLGLVTGDITESTITTANSLKTGYGEVFIDAYYTLTADEINLCKNANLALEVYTVNKVSDVKALDAYVSGVTSDYIVAGKVLGE